MLRPPGGPMAPATLPPEAMAAIKLARELDPDAVEIVRKISEGLKEARAQGKLQLTMTIELHEEGG